MADKSFPGIVLVDLEAGAAIERVALPGLQPVGIASCPQCDFIALSSGSGAILWRLALKDTVETLLEQRGRLALADLAAAPILFPEGEPGAPTDARMLLVVEAGRALLVASSDDRKLYRLELDGVHATRVTTLGDFGQSKPFGLNVAGDDQFFVTMHKRFVYRTNQQGEVIQRFDTVAAGCAGHRDKAPNLRAATADPTDEKGLLVLASSPLSYDAVVWRLTAEADGGYRCENLVSRAGRTSGWIDGVGEEVYFSRPHHMVVRPGTAGWELVLTDIDNRALRIVDVASRSTHSVPYARDLAHRSGRVAKSRKSCDELAWPDSVAVLTPGGTRSCLRRPEGDPAQRTHDEARAACDALGARLCEPMEIRQAGLAARLPSWSSAACAGCWLKTEFDRCEHPITNFRTPGATHSSDGFRHSWASGHAMEARSGATPVPQTYCLATSEESPLADALCCADETRDP